MSVRTYVERLDGHVDSTELRAELRDAIQRRGIAVHHDAARVFCDERAYELLRSLLATDVDDLMALVAKAPGSPLGALTVAD
jgi:hypothetical protein